MPHESKKGREDFGKGGFREGGGPRMDRIAHTVLPPHQNAWGKKGKHAGRVEGKGRRVDFGNSLDGKKVPNPKLMPNCNPK